MRVLAVALIALSTAGASALAQDAPAKPEQPPAAATAAATNYTIGPSDVLQIIVWKEPELTRDVTVRFDGKITVPLLGDLQAAGRTPAEVADSLTQGLKHFIDAPRVTVGISQANSSRFYVVGLVIRSGEFPLAGHTTVLQGLALAGGFKEFAKTDGIVIVRRDQSVVPVNYKRIADGKDVAQNVLLAPGDTIVVP
jgi:polysaccharide export outer membrane protein